MPEYRPDVRWNVTQRVTTARCADCVESEQLSGYTWAREHVMANPTHKVTTMAVVVSIMSLRPGTEAQAA